MKALWLCNIVLPEFSQEFNLKKNNFGGWITGMLHGLEKTGEVDISLCFPIKDEQRLRNGICNGHRYYSFLCDFQTSECKEETIKTFENILKDCKPDIVHIWGTEYVHTLAMLKACEKRGILDKAVINIQGLVSVCARHYMADIPENYRKLQNANGTSIRSGQSDFENRGICEVESIRMVKHVIGRTDWDRACAEAINPDVSYHYCGEILRDIFYRNIGVWKYETCHKHSIFVSQASYPIKGFHYLLQALPIVIRKYSDMHVYVAGTNIMEVDEPTAYAKYVIEVMDKYNLHDYVSFMGNIDEKRMLEQYINANVFVSPSAIENSSNSVCEAMLVGTPVVASYVGGTGNIIEDKKTGYLYPCREIEMLAYYICELFENKKDICTQFSSKSVTHIKEKCMPKKNIENTLKCYKDLVK